MAMSSHCRYDNGGKYFIHRHTINNCILSKSFGCISVKQSYILYITNLDLSFSQNQISSTKSNLPDNTPKGEEVKWLLKEGGGLIFKCLDISLESTPTLHVVYISTPTTNHLSTLVPSQS